MRFCNALLGAPVGHLGPVAQACEEAGFDSVAMSDHAFIPERLESTYPYTPDGRPQFDDDADFPDPCVSIGLIAAVTTRLRFLTNVYVLPLRNPFVTAKAVGTAACLSGNRVVLGVGAGWMREEFDQLGQPFAGRGRRMDEAITVIRTLWRGGMVEHHGEFYDFDRLEMRPAPTQPVPIYVGGDSDIALRRAATVGDGWIGMYHTVDQLKDICARLRRYREEAGRAEAPFEVVSSPLVVPRPDTVAALERIGVDTILTSAWIAAGQNRVSGDQAVDLVGTYGEQVIAPLGS